MRLPALLCWIAGLLLVPLAADAAAPQQRTSPPGVYRMMIGDIEVTALSDGTMVAPLSRFLQNIAQARADELLARQLLKEPVATSVNAFLVNTGEKLVLVDAGAGAFLGPNLGRVGAALAAAGYRPEQVDEVYVTHLHGDHAGGLVSGGGRAFVNATVRAEQAEADFWLDTARRDAAPKELQPAFAGAQAALAPYVAAGRFKPFAGDTALVPGVRAQVTRGHTPGHTVYVIESRGETLVLWGDLLHVPAVQFVEPAVTISFDSDAGTAARERQRQFAAAARDGHWVGAAHLPFPGIGRLRSDGAGGYVYVPANYVALPAGK